MIHLVVPSEKDCNEIWNDDLVDSTTTLGFAREILSRYAVLPGIEDLYDKAMASLAPTGPAFAEMLLSKVAASLEDKKPRWINIQLMNLDDSLVWLRKGNNVDGPREPSTDDYDLYTHWAPVESPPLDDV